MGDTLTDEQREMVTREARNIAYAKALLQVVKPLNGVEALSALATALTTVIGAGCKPTERLNVLNALLGVTITEWAAEAAGAQAAGATLQ